MNKQEIEELQTSTSYLSDDIQNEKKFKKIIFDAIPIQLDRLAY